MATNMARAPTSTVHAARPHAASRPVLARRASVQGSRRLQVVVRAEVEAEAKAGPSAQEAAEKRWVGQVRAGMVKNVSARDAGELMQSGWMLLDVRPPTETEKVHITGAVEVPLFVPDTGVSLGSLMARFSAWGTGGWWLGGSHTIANPNFMNEVQAQIPKDSKVVVGCQKGLRSLAAAEQLAKAGYQSLAWVNGGFDSANPGDIPTTNGKDIRYAGIGGMSEMLGWTEVQQSETKGFMGGFNNVLKLVALVLLVDGAVFAYEYWAYLAGAPNIFNELMQ